MDHKYTSSNRAHYIEFAHSQRPTRSTARNRRELMRDAWRKKSNEIVVYMSGAVLGCECVQVFLPPQHKDHVLLHSSLLVFYIMYYSCSSIQKRGPDGDGNAISS